MSKLTLLTAALAAASAAFGSTIGESLIDRPAIDTAVGGGYLFNGALPNGERITGFSFFNNNPADTDWVTPLLLDLLPGGNYQIAGIGASIQNTGAGVQSHAFNLVTGTDLITDSDFVFGWWNGRISGASFFPNNGVIEFTANTSNPGFRESCPSPNVGPCNISPTLGLTIPFNNNYTNGPQPGSFGAPNGRIYSASVTTDEVTSGSPVPEPSTYALILAGVALLAGKKRR